LKALDIFMVVAGTTTFHPTWYELVTHLSSAAVRMEKEYFVAVLLLAKK
jgi:hypothetical protein